MDMDHHGTIFGGPCPGTVLHTSDDTIPTEGLVDCCAHHHLSGIHPLYKKQAIFTDPSHGPPLSPLRHVVHLRLRKAHPVGTNGATSPHFLLPKVCKGVGLV